MTEQGVFTDTYCLTAEYCDISGEMSPLGPFIIFQAMAMRHNETTDNGVMAMAKRGKFWLVVHSRVDYFAPGELMKYVTVDTWPEHSEGKSIRCYRDYCIRDGQTILAEGRTQWAVCSAGGSILPFSESGFGEDFPYSDKSVSVPLPTRFRDHLTEADHCADYLVCRSDLDFVGHMNNTAYVRLLLDHIRKDELTGRRIKYIEIHYSRPCMGGETIRLFSAQEKDRLLFSFRNEAGVVAAQAIVGLSEQSI